jgi:hypothetical protein
MGVGAALGVPPHALVAVAVLKRARGEPGRSRVSVMVTTRGSLRCDKTLDFLKSECQHGTVFLTVFNADW